MLANQKLFLCYALFALFCSSLPTFARDAPAGNKVLVILNDLEMKATHSKFLKHLEDHFSVEYGRADNKNLPIKKYGEWQFDHILVLVSNTDEISSFSSSMALEYVDSGRNLFIATDSRLPATIREIATEINVEFDSKNTFVIDHFQYDKSDFDGQHTLIAVPFPQEPTPIFGKSKERSPILFRGIAQDIEEDSDLLFSALSASPTAYSHATEAAVTKLNVAGRRISLTSVLQARNNARVVLAGSIEMFSDKFFASSVQVGDKKYDASGNEEFAKSLVTWTFQERAILRVKSVTHHRKGETAPPPMYTIKEDLEYTIEIEEWNGKKWAPFVADDVQLEFIMLDPYIRTTLTNNGKGAFSTSFRVPDVYGFFTFKVEYSRKGLGHLTSIERIPVRPFRHTQYERFIDAAYPYYASSLSMLAGLFLFSFVFLYNREKN